MGRLEFKPGGIHVIADDIVNRCFGSDIVSDRLWVNELRHQAVGCGCTQCQKSYNQILREMQDKYGVYHPENKVLPRK